MSLSKYRPSKTVVASAGLNQMFPTCLTDGTDMEVGYVSNGSLLTGPKLQNYLKHKGAWGSAFSEGPIVVISRKVPHDVYYNQYKGNEISVILMDRETFLDIFSNLEEHITETLEVGEMLAKEWNTRNANNPEGQKTEVTYRFVVHTDEWLNKRGVKQTTHLKCHLSTWQFTRDANEMPEPVCEPNNVVVGFSSSSVSAITKQPFFFYLPCLCFFIFFRYNLKHRALDSPANQLLPAITTSLMTAHWNTTVGD